MTSLEAVVAQSEQTAPKKKRDREIRRDTTLSFSNPDEMRTAFARIGFNPYRTYHRKRFWDVEFNEIIGETTAYHLRKHGLKVREDQEEYEDTEYTEIEAIKTKFKLKDVYMEIYTYSFRLRTFGFTARQHKAAVMRILGPIRKAGFDVKHECQSEMTDRTC